MQKLATWLVGLLTDLEKSPVKPEELGKKFQIRMAAALVTNQVPVERVTLIDDLRFDRLSLEDSQAAGQPTEVKEEERAL